MLSDKVIIDGIKAKDNRKVLNTFYSELLPSIVKFVKSKGGNLQEAEDCFQDAVVSLISKVRRNDFDDQLNVRNYVFVAARNRWFSMVSRVKMKEEELGDNDGQSFGYEYMLDDEKQAVISKVLSLLGEQCNKLLTLYVYENKKMSEIKDLLGMKSMEVVKSTKYRCKKKMQELLEKNPEYKVVIRG